MKNPSQNLLILLSLFFLSACSSDDAIVDSKLEPYFESFAAEAAARGVIFDNEVEAIDGYLQNIIGSSGGDLLGACRAADNLSPRRSIFIDEPFWNDTTDLAREFVVFHELGHCFLDRSHINGTDSLGNCISIMAAGNASCNGLAIYTADRREALLDELFRN